MKFEILNVEHGFAAYAEAADGSILMFDCGECQACCPSDYLSSRGIRAIRRLFITNYDEDHIGDLPRLRSRLPIGILTRNASLTSAQLRSLKTPPLSRAMLSLLDMIDSYTDVVSNEQLEPYGVRIWTFQNDYPTFTDTNNLSLLTFVDVGNVSFVIPGDLERPGWLALLENPHVLGLLCRVNVFVASHHGRESGYCKEVFDHCRPALIIMSDESVQYDTQRMAGIYAQHASGEWFNGGSGQEFRKVLSTRSDGNLLWQL